MTRRMIVTIPDSVDATDEDLISDATNELWASIYLSGTGITIEDSEELPLRVDTRVALLDQGVTRLQLLAFLRGEHSDVWNGSAAQWIRYRAHQVDRETTPDGTTIRLIYIAHDEGPEAATFEAAPGSDQDAAVTLRLIDTIIDAAIAHHGPDGVA